MTVPCVVCHEKFGGHETYQRHLLKREERCRTAGEMKARGMLQDPLGVWHRWPAKVVEQPALIDRRSVPTVSGKSRWVLSDSVGPSGRLAGGLKESDTESTAALTEAPTASGG